MIKCIIFDFFGVICPDLHRVWTKKHRIPTSIYEEVGGNVDLGLAPEDAYIKNLSRKTGILASKIKKELEDEIVIDQNILFLIKDLKEKYKIGLLSDANAALLNRILRNHELESYFDVIGVSSEIGHTKPHPEAFSFILDKLGLKPTEAVFIDDSKSNIKGAEQLGLKSLLYMDVGSLKKDLARLL